MSDEIEGQTDIFGQLASCEEDPDAVEDLTGDPCPAPWEPETVSETAGGSDATQ